MPYNSLRRWLPAVSASRPEDVTVTDIRGWRAVSQDDEDEDEDSDDEDFEEDDSE